ncbi:hypothetical protein KUW00_18215 [Halomonas sp. DP5N14-9]|uniref:hypothetical protein n=1 Tax=Halomonas sp. DP5N14-9 TaxID=2859075 RepID=UPI001C9A038F|nr:hypothetical protein [Halomonas sp. DP5N14-9]MBY5942815.1 hypothetical protein [Halomonas sp. DP5N14-9]
MSRQAGWYWVKGMLGCDDWSPSYWDSRLARWDSLIPDGDEIEAGPRIPTPDEPWQCVPVEPTREMLESTGDTSASAYHGMLGAWTVMLAAAPKPGGEE